MLPDLASFIPTHGYWLAFVGALLEGETVLVLGGLAAHRGLLSLPHLFAVGALGGVLGDQIGFAVGRRFGARALARLPRLAPAVARVHTLVERHTWASVIAVRFLYGMRIAGPIAIGTSRIHWATFALLNAAGAALWCAAWVAAGYLAGEAVQAALGNLKRYEHALFGLALALAIAASVWLHVRRRRGYVPKTTTRSGSERPSPGTGR
jgi:membrane protein DedA with SNARE-associated domain